MVHAVRCCKLRVLASKWVYRLGIRYKIIHLEHIFYARLNLYKILPGMIYI